MNIKRIINSFKSAFTGVVTVYKSESNFRIQIVIAIIVIISMFFFDLNLIERGLLLLLILIVLILEMLNSVLERFIDILKPRVHDYVKEIKDIAAGAVLIASLGSVLIGILIFYNHLKDLFFR